MNFVIQMQEELKYLHAYINSYIKYCDLLEKEKPITIGYCVCAKQRIGTASTPAASLERLSNVLIVGPSSTRTRVLVLRLHPHPKLEWIAPISKKREYGVKFKKVKIQV